MARWPKDRDHSNNKVLSITISKRLKEDFMSATSKNGVSASSVAREFIEKYLNKQKEKNNVD